MCDSAETKRGRRSRRTVRGGYLGTLAGLICLLQAGCGGGGASPPAPAVHIPVATAHVAPSATSTSRLALAGPSATGTPTAAPAPASLTDLGGVWAIASGPDELTLPNDGTTPVAVVRQHDAQLSGMLVSRYARYQMIGTFDQASGAVSLLWYTLRAGKAVAQGTLTVDGRHINGTYSDRRAQGGGFSLIRLGSADSAPAGLALAALANTGAGRSPTPTEIALPTPVPPGYVAGFWIVAGPTPVQAQTIATILRLDQGRQGALTGVLTDMTSGRFAVTGAYNAASGVTLNWATPAGTYQFQGVLSSDRLTLQGTRLGPDGSIPWTYTRLDDTTLLTPTPVPPGVTPDPTATLFITPTPVPPGYLDGLWLWNGSGPTNFYPRDTTLTLHKDPENTLSGVLTDAAGERYAVAGTYTGQTGGVLLTWLMPDGPYRFEGTVDSTLTSMQGTWTGPSTSEPSGFTRAVGGTPTANTATSPGPTATIYAPPTPTIAPTDTDTPIPPTPYPAAYVAGTWTWDGTAPDPIVPGGSTLMLHTDHNGALSGVLAVPDGARYAVAVVYSPTTLSFALAWAMPKGIYHYKGAMNGEILYVDGNWTGPDGNGEASFSRMPDSALPAAATVPPGSRPIPTATLFVPPTAIPAGYVNGPWVWTHAVPPHLQRAGGTAVLTLRLQRKGRLTGVLTAATGDRYGVSGTYAARTRGVILEWYTPWGPYRVDGSVALDMVSMQGQIVGPDGRAGFSAERAGGALQLVPTPVAPGTNPRATPTLYVVPPATLAAALAAFTPPAASTATPSPSQSPAPTATSSPSQSPAPGANLTTIPTMTLTATETPTATATTR